MTWNERDHPRNPHTGEFTEDWLGALSARLPGEFTSAMHWRVVPSSLAPGIVPGDDSHNAEQQIRAAEENFGGLGKWWGRTEGDNETQGRALAAFYAAPTSVLIGARMRPEDAAAIHDPDNWSGLIARNPTQVLVEQVHVMESDGSWTRLDVPPGLTAWTRTPDEEASR